MRHRLWERLHRKKPADRKFSPGPRHTISSSRDAPTGSAHAPQREEVETAASVGSGLTKTPIIGWTVLLLFRFQESSAAMTSLAFGFFLPFIREDLGLSYSQSGLLQFANGIPPLLLSVPFTAVFSRFRPVGLIFATTIVAIPFVALQGLLAFNFATLFLFRVLFSAFRVAEAPARTMLMQQWAARKDYTLFQSVALSQHSVLLASAFATLPLIIGGVGGWRHAMYLLAGILLIELLVWRSLARERNAPVKEFSRALKGGAPNPWTVARKYPQVWILGIVMFCLGVTWSGMVTFLPTLLKEERGIALTWGGPLSSLLYFGLAATAPFGDFIGRKVPNRRVLLSVTALANMLVGVAIALTPNPWILVGLLLALGAVWAPSPPIQVIPFEFPGITSREVAVASSIKNTVSGAGFALGPVITGFSADIAGSLVMGMVVMCLFTGIGVIVGLFYSPSAGRKPAPAPSAA